MFCTLTFHLNLGELPEQGAPGYRPTLVVRYLPETVHTGETVCCNPPSR